MRHLVRAVSSEILKLKRTLALWMVFISPAVVVLLIFANYLQRGESFVSQSSAPWLSFAQGVFILWSILMLPLFIALEASLLGGVEHSGANWKHLFALPTPKWSIYAAKILVMLALVALAVLALVVMTVLAGWSLALLRPRIGFSFSFPAMEMLAMAFGPYAAAVLIIALHTWLSTRWGNFVIGLGVGISGTVVNAIILGSEFGRLYPWALPVVVESNLFQIIRGADAAGAWADIQVCLALALAGFLVVAIAGGWDFVRRDVL